MNHFTLPRFWKCYDALPADVRTVADQQFARLKADPDHPSLHFKRIGALWSFRNFRIVQSEGVRQVSRAVGHYSLDADLPHRGASRLRDRRAAEGVSTEQRTGAD